MLYDQITEHYKTAFKAKDDIKKGILSYIIAQVKNKQIELQKDVEDADVISIIKKEIKARQETMEYLEKAGKLDDISIEQQIIDILTEYLPQMLSKAQLVELVQQVISQQGITDIGKQRGEIVKAIMVDHKAETDGRLLQEVINEVQL